MSIEDEIARRIESAIESIMDDYDEENIKWADAEWYPDDGATCLVKIRQEDGS